MVERVRHDLQNSIWTIQGLIIGVLHDNRPQYSSRQTAFGVEVSIYVSVLAVRTVPRTPRTARTDIS